MSKRLALIVGNSLYRDEKLTRLTAPDADVGELADVLLDPEFGGFDDVKLLVNLASHIVRKEIFSFFSKKTREDMLLFYFSGHGVLDDQGKLFLALKDTDTQALRGTAIPASYVTNEMDSSRSKRQLVILDCCHSGAFARGSKGSPGMSVGTANTFEGSGFGRVVLAASDATQYAWEGDQIVGEATNSLFTHFLVRGIKTGEADTNHDGKITVDELYDYAYSQILSETSKQTPGKWSFKEQGEMIISRASMIETSYQSSQEIPVFRKEVEEQLDQLYTRGLSAYWLEDWASVLEYFEAVQEISPGYLDVEDKLEVARNQKKIEDLYHQAIKSREEGNLKKAISEFENLLVIAPDYKDVAEKLNQVKEEKKLVDLYAQAKHLFDSGMFEAVVKVIEAITEQNPNFHDPDRLLEKSKAKIEEIDLKKSLEDLYRQAVFALNSGKLAEAKNIILQIHDIEMNYADTNKLLARVNSLIDADTETKSEADHVEKVDFEDHILPERTSIEEISDEPQKFWSRVRIFAQGLNLWQLITLISVFVIVIASAIILGIKGVSEKTSLEEMNFKATQTQVEAENTSTKYSHGGLQINPIDNAVYVNIPAGDFLMGSADGSDDENPVHEIFLDSFWIGQTEVTNANYQLCVSAGECKSSRGKNFNNEAFADHPVVGVNWSESQSYCEWVGGRLPTEAEWEKAARGGLDSYSLSYPWGNGDPDCTLRNQSGAQNETCDGETAPVGSFARNQFGLYDMAGNVYEWVGDWYDANYYSISESSNPTGPDEGQERVLRGGSWIDSAINLRVANRYFYDPSGEFINIGFRCVIEIPSQAP